MAHAQAKTQYPTLSTPLILLFNLLTLVWWLEVGLRVPAFAAIRLEFLLAATVSALALIRHWSKPRTAMPRARVGTAGGETNSDLIRCIVIYLLVLALSLPLAIDFDLAWDAFINRVAKLALLGVLIPQFVVSPITLRIYFFTLLLAFMKVGQEGFLGRITGNMVWENQGVPRLHGTYGTMFGDPNSLSGKTVSTVPFLWYFFPRVQQPWIKVMMAVQVLFAVNIIVFTGSRTGYVAFLASTLLMVMYSNQKKVRLILLLSLVSVIAVNFVPAQYKARFMSSFTGQEAEGQSSATRKSLFFDSVNTFAEHPLGIGLHGFARNQAIHGRNAQETHNLYTQILAETGIQGFICFVALIYLLLRKALRARKAFAQIIARLESHAATSEGPQRDSIDSELRDARLLFAGASALIVFTFTRLILGVFGHDFLEIYWWFAAGVAMALHNLRAIAEQRCAELTTAAQT